MDTDIVGGPPEIVIISERRPRATRNYQCSCCGLGIARNSAHTYYVVKDEDGKFRTFRTHLICP